MTLMRRMPTPGYINKKSNETETPVALAERAFFFKKKPARTELAGSSSKLVLLRTHFDVYPIPLVKHSDAGCLPVDLHHFANPQRYVQQ